MKLNRIELRGIPAMLATVPIAPFIILALALGQAEAPSVEESGGFRPRGNRLSADPIAYVLACIASALILGVPYGIGLLLRHP